MKHRILAGALAALFLAPAAHAAVGVRVEGATQTLVPRTEVPATGDRATSPGGNDCAGDTAIGALDRATGGDWDGSPGTVERILTETQAFGPGDPDYYWTFWKNYEYQNAGACDTKVRDGDEVLFFVDCFGDCASPKPLRLEVPANAKPGSKVAVKVTEYSVTFDENFVGTTSSAPSPNATVEVGDRSYATDAQGIAQVETFARGPLAMRAVKRDYVRSSIESTCVTDGADGFCGTTKPGEPAPAPAPVVAPDRQHPFSRFTSPLEGSRFTRARAPRQVGFEVGADPSGIHSVKLRLTRRYRGRCWYFSPKADNFVRTRCGRAFYFRVSGFEEGTFLLPSRLGPGRYVFDIKAVDRLFNREPLARGRNRVVFGVR